MNSKRILLTTGGTGGHIFPALAVAEQLRLADPEVQLLFVGTVKGPEGELTKQNDIPFIGLPVSGVLGRGLQAFGALYGLGKGVIRAKKILEDFKPSVVAGFGSYASFPSLFAAKMEGVPVVIHEQNAIPGLSNRLCGKMANRIFLSLPDTLHRFEPSKTILTGNPVRESIARLAEISPVPSDRPRLLIMGGSQGAKAINTAMLDAFPHLSDDILIHHQTGKADYQRVSDAYRQMGADADRVTVEPFINDIAEVYAETDLAVCRSGATTVAELSLAGKPAVFIPFPFATHHHQSANAKAMEDAGAARCIEEDELPNIDLPTVLNDLLHDRNTLDTMGIAAKTMAKPKAAYDVAQGILQLAFGR